MLYAPRPHLTLPRSKVNVNAWQRDCQHLSIGSARVRVYSGPSEIVHAKYYGPITHTTEAALWAFVAKRLFDAAGVIEYWDGAAWMMRAIPIAVAQPGPLFGAVIALPEQMPMAQAWCRAMSELGLLRTAWPQSLLEQAQTWLGRRFLTNN